MAPLPTHRERKILVEIEKIAGDFSPNQLIKAAHALATRGVRSTRNGELFRVRSFARPGVWYRTTIHACSCDAHVLCWHIAAVRIFGLYPMLETLDEHTGTIPSGRTEVWPS
jgi:hypothetical protein